MIISAAALIAAAAAPAPGIHFIDALRFSALHQATGGNLDAATLQADYLDRGTVGLEDFLELRIETAEQLAATIARAPRYYAAVAECVRELPARRAEYDAIYASFRGLLPERELPPAYFVVGRANSGGTTSDRGVLIGAEIYCRTDATPLDELSDWLAGLPYDISDMPHLVAHELAHTIQAGAGDDSLLTAVVREGGADFVAELVSGDRLNSHLEAWAEPRAAELWAEFAARMDDDSYEGWLYDGDNADGRPADLGYWLGYEIAKAYYDRAEDKAAALRAVLDAGEDAAAFLEASGYAERFE
jgi:hypothetical protein